MYIVELEVVNNIAVQYLANWSGDPGRTCIIEKAKKYKNISSATFALAHARKYRDFKNARIVEI